jgi:hypothetical protein
VTLSGLVEEEMVTAPLPGQQPHGVSATKRSPILTETSWSPRRELTLAEWLRHGRTLGAVARAAGWWIGDWSRYGSAKYGEKYEAAARITGYDIQSLMNMAYVASRFEISRRREKLSFSHHAELAALPPDEQEHWLNLAEQEGLSVHALRERLRRHACSPRRMGPPRLVDRAEVSAEREPGSDAEIICPQCGLHFHPRSVGEPQPAAGHRRSDPREADIRRPAPT